MNSWILLPFFKYIQVCLISIYKYIEKNLNDKNQMVSNGSHKEENGIQERKEWVLSFFILYCTVFIHRYCSNFYREQIVTLPL